MSSLAVLAALAGCRSSTPATPEQAHREVTAAAARGDAVEVYRLLDRETRWSLISLFEAQREIRQLVHKRYPADRRARELRRTQLVARARNAAALFVLLAEQERLLQGLAGAGAGDRARKQAGQVTIHSRGQPYPYCREDRGWKYCGLRDLFERMKVRASRDLVLVKQNAAAFDKSR